MGEQEVLVEQETANDKESETYSISQSVSQSVSPHSLTRSLAETDNRAEEETPIKGPLPTLCD